MTALRWKPLRSAGVYTRRDGDVTLIEGYLDAYETNHVGAFIWSRCRGELAVAELGNLVAGRFDVDPDEANADVEAFVTDLRELGFVV